MLLTLASRGVSALENTRPFLRSPPGLTAGARWSRYTLSWYARRRVRSTSSVTDLSDGTTSSFSHSINTYYSLLLPVSSLVLPRKKSPPRARLREKHGAHQWEEPRSRPGRALGRWLLAEARSGAGEESGR